MQYGDGSFVNQPVEYVDPGSSSAFLWTYQDGDGQDYSGSYWSPPYWHDSFYSLPSGEGLLFDGTQWQYGTWTIAIASYFNGFFPDNSNTTYLITDDCQYAYDTSLLALCTNSSILIYPRYQTLL